MAPVFVFKNRFKKTATERGSLQEEQQTTGSGGSTSNGRSSRNGGRRRSASTSRGSGRGGTAGGSLGCSSGERNTQGDEISNGRHSNGGGSRSTNNGSTDGNSANGTVSNRQADNLELLDAAKRFHTATIARKAMAEQNFERAKAEFMLAAKEENKASHYLTKVETELEQRGLRFTKHVPHTVSEDWSNSCIKPFEGHVGGVSAVTMFDSTATDSSTNAGVNSVVAVDDSKFLAASGDSTILLWDASAGLCIRKFEGHTDSVNCLDVFGVDRMHAMTEEDSAASTVASSAFVDRFISGSKDGVVRFWSLSSGKCLSEYKGHDGEVLSVAFLDVNRFVSGSSDCTIRLWNTSMRECLHIFTGHSEPISSIVAMSTKAFLSGSGDKTIKLWNANSGDCRRTYVGHGSGVSALANIGEGRFLSASREESIKLWEATSPEPISRLSGHQLGIQALALCENGGKRFLSGSCEGNISLWSLP